MNLEERIAAETEASSAASLWNDCLVVLLLSATHFRKSGQARLIRRCFSFSQCFRAGVFSSLFPPPPHSLWLAPSPPLFGKFQHGAFTGKLRAQRKRLHCRLDNSFFSVCGKDKTLTWAIIDSLTRCVCAVWSSISYVTFTQACFHTEPMPWTVVYGETRSDATICTTKSSEAPKI